VTHLVAPVQTPDRVYVCVLAQQGMEGTEQYSPGREVEYVQVPRPVRQMPAVRVIEAVLPGLSSLRAGESDGNGAPLLVEADKSARSERAETAPLCRQMRGVCLGLASRHRGATACVVAWAVRKTVFVFDSSTRRLHAHPMSRLITALTVMPSPPDDFLDVGSYADPSVTVGDVDGRLASVFCLSDEQLDTELPNARLVGDVEEEEEEAKSAGSSAPVTVRHWHAHAVGACLHSSDGASLLSGGEEAVLVRWVGDSKAFLPRLGAPVTAISESVGSAPGLPPLVAMCLSDCSIVMVDASAPKVLWRVRGLALAGSLGPHTAHHPSAHAVMTVDPRTGCVALNSVPGRPSLQLYDVRRGRHAAEVQVSHSSQPIAICRYTSCLHKHRHDWHVKLATANRGHPSLTAASCRR
jgi:hypothetical protein